MDIPVFPQSFVEECCPKVLEARRWQKCFAPEESIDANDFAECAFIPCGFGLKCENCGCFIFDDGGTPHTKGDVYHIPICQYYKQMDEYEEWQKQEELARLAAEQNFGSGI